MKAVVCQADTPLPSTNNIYPRHLLEREIGRLLPIVQNRGWYGILGIPSEASIVFDRASHLITDIYFEGNDLTIEIEILPMESGEVLRQLLDSGADIGFMLSGIGYFETDNQNRKILNDNYRLCQICASFLCEPVPDNPIMVKNNE